MAVVASLRMLSLGPVTFPIDVLSTIPTPQSLKTVCCGQTEPHSPTAVTMPKTCEHCGVITDPTALKKAAKAGNDWILVDGAPDRKVDNQKIVLTPHPKEQIDLQTMPSGKTYWIKPSKNSDPSAYGLFRDLIGADDKHSYMTMWAVRSKPAMYELTVHGNALVLVERVHLSDANPAPTVDASHTSEADLANMLLITESKSEPFSKDKYTDNAMADLLAGGQRVSIGTAPTPTGGSLSDLLASVVNDLSSAPKAKPVRKPRTRKPKVSTTDTMSQV